MPHLASRPIPLPPVVHSEQSHRSADSSLHVPAGPSDGSITISGHRWLGSVTIR